MHGWHCYIFKTYPPGKLSKLRTTSPRSLAQLRTAPIVSLYMRYDTLAVLEKFFAGFYVSNQLFIFKIILRQFKIEIENRENKKKQKKNMFIVS